MNYLDVIILAPIVWGLYRGFSKGLIVEVASLIALVAGIWCAIHFNEAAASILVNDLSLNISDHYLAPVSFAVTFIAVAFVIVLVSRVIDKILSAVALGGINKVFGAIFGGTKAFIILAVVLYFVHQFDSQYQFLNEDKKSSSVFYQKMVGLVEEWIPRINLDEIKEELPDMKSKAKSLKEA